MRAFKIGFSVCASLLISLPVFATPVLDANQILPYLEKVISWQRDATSLEVDQGNTREALMREALTQSATQILKASFDFARTQAALIDHQPSSESETANQNDDRAHLQKASETIAQHTIEIQGEIAALNPQIRKSSSKQRADLKAKRDALKNELQLLAAQQNLVNNLLDVFTGVVASPDTTLLGKINTLSDSVSATSVASNSSEAATTAKKSESSTHSEGLFAIGADVFTLWGRLQNVESLINEATDLHKTNREFQDRLRQSLRGVIQTGTSSSSSSSPPQDTDRVLNNFKQISAGIVPLAQTNIWLDASRRTLGDWKSTLLGELRATLRHLFLRLAILGVILLIPIGLAIVARHATERYVKDPRRLKQLHTLRRTFLTIVILIIVILNMVTEIGSVATFAGFLTAGLAVAFQNVLLSLVAYFFFYGRYSVRAGDRVSVSGVIGDVVHVGVMRFYIRELEGTETLKPTGRIAAFPNSILFQTSAFFKYV